MNETDSNTVRNTTIRTKEPRPRGIALKKAVLFAAATLGASLMAHGAGAQAPVLDPKLNEQVIMVPVAPSLARTDRQFGWSSGDDVEGPATVVAPASPGNGWSAELETTIYKPPGDGPFPLLVMNHGKALGDPRGQERARFRAISREFVKRGYAVIVPMRSGFARSTGEYVEEHCNMTANGHIQADDVQGVLEFATAQPWADKNRIVVGGQSYGGLASVAFATRNFPGVRGVINFAGGLRTTAGGCRWQESLVQAFARYGERARVPSLWFYGENDSYFGPELARRMHAAYARSGGAATLVSYGPFKHDAHLMSGSREGVGIWWPETERFLRSIGMPTEALYAVAEPAAPVRTDFAAVQDIDAVPHLGEKARAQYRAFLDKPMPRAFALSETGAWSWAEGDDDPADRALTNCARHSRVPCKLYAIDDYVVWDAGKRI